MADTLILPLANSLLECLQTAATANPDPPANFCLRVGTSVIQDIDAGTGVDTVCCPGLGYVAVGQLYPSSAFPEPDARTDKCLYAARALQLTMGIVRCVPGMGTPEGPSCADWTAAAVRDADDIDALFDAACCWVGTGEFKVMRGRPYTISGVTVEQTADCIERTMTILVQIGRCC
jgi:hypothetical protein